MDSEAALVRHLLRRFGLGTSEAEAAYYVEGGYEPALGRLLASDGHVDGFDADLAKFGNDQGLVQTRSVQVRWYTRMLATRRPLVHALTLFWHDHFATSATKVDKPMMMHAHLETLEAGALGKFSDLLRAVSQDPAMLYWLDNHENVKGRPNENFARELLELFTLGIGHYTEKDVLETARAFTGWTFVARGQGRNVRGQGLIRFVDRREAHDDGSKTILGKTGPFDGDAVLELLCAHPQTALHLARKAWEWFAYPDPEQKLVERIADEWRKEGMTGRGLARLIALAPEFRGERARRSIVKNPVQFCIAAMRQAGLGQVAAERLAVQAPGQRAGQPGAIAHLACKAMGMELLYPPDVAGWETGESWITSATMVERIKLADRIFPSAARELAFRLLSPDPTPEGIVAKLVSIFDADLPEAKLAALREAAKAAVGPRLTRQNARGAAVAVSRLVFGSPEFQFA